MIGKLLKAKDVAEILNISKSQAYFLMRNGSIPIIQFGRTIRVSHEALEDFIKLCVSNRQLIPTKGKLAAGTASQELFDKPPVKEGLSYE